MAKGKGGSKALTGILCFIFGFLFAIIAEAAVIFGGVMFLMKADIDTILSTVGVDNYDEDAGKNIYINTNVEEGGVQKITDLISALKEFSSKGTQNLTIGDITTLFPIGDTFIDKAYSSLADALAAYNISEEELREIVDPEELKATTIAGLGEFFKQCGEDVKVETVMRMAGMNVEDSPVYLAVAYGERAEVMYSLNDGSVTVLGKDVFLYNGNYYLREGDGAELTADEAKYLIKQSDDTYALYYSIPVNSAAGSQVASYEDGIFVESGVRYTLYSADTAVPSGGYYYDEAGELVVVHSRTIGEVSSDEEGALTVEQAIRMIYLSDILGDISVDDSVMAYMIYGINDIQPVSEGDAVPEGVTHTATYHMMGKDGKPATDSDGNEVTKTAYIVTTNGAITDVYYVEETQNGGVIKVDCRTTVDETPERVNGLKNNLTLGELLGEEINNSENVVLYALRNSTINTLASDVANLTVQQLFAKDIYANGEGDPALVASEADFNLAYLYYEKNAEGEFVLVNGTGKPEAFVEGMYYTYGAPTGVWSLLLYNNGSEQKYGINDVATLQGNVTQNLKTTTLSQFMEMGIITENSSGTLEMDLARFERLGGYTAPAGKEYVGDLTISEFIQLIGALGTYVDQAQGQNP